MKKVIAKTQFDIRHYVLSNDLTSNFDSSKVIQDLSRILGGKGGGGRKDLAQAGALNLDNVNKAIDQIKDNLNF